MIIKCLGHQCPITEFIESYEGYSALVDFATNVIIHKNKAFDTLLSNIIVLDYGLLISREEDTAVKANLEFCKLVDYLLHKNDVPIFVNELFGAKCYATVRVPIIFNNQHMFMILINERKVNNDLLNRISLCD